MSVARTHNRILVVGAGLSGACAAWLIRSQKPPLPEVILWDKARGAGGRMSTSRSKEGILRADLGAQYITSRSHSDRFSRIYEPLVREGLLVRTPSLAIEGKREQADTVAEYAAPQGMSTVVKRFIEASGAVVEFNKEVASLSQDGTLGPWLVTTKDGASDRFDCVLLTMPVPQILTLLARSQIHKVDSEAADLMAEVTYSSRYALGLHYFGHSGDLTISKTAQELWPNSGTYAKYIQSGNEVFRYARLDRQDGDGSSVVLHTSVEFGAKHVDLPKDQVEAVLLGEVSRQFPDWPAPGEVKCHKWRYSQVTTPYIEKPGYLWLDTKGSSGLPTLMALGDGFIGSGFESCVESAYRAVMGGLLGLSTHTSPETMPTL